MKQYTLYTILVLVGLFLLNACTQEDLLPKKETVVEGIPTTVKLAFSAPGANKISTKGSLEDKDEYAVQNLFVYVFKKTTSGGWEQEYADISKFTTSEEGSNSKGIVVMNITSGEKKIYAIANVENNPTLNFADGLSTLKAATTIEAVEGLAASGMVFVSRDQAGQMMSGMYNTDGFVTINPNGTMTAGSIKLRHLDSKITFKIKSAPNITFIPKEWRVYRAPRRSYVFESNADVVGEEGDGYFNMEDYTNFEVLDGVGSDSKGGSFTFYMLENRKTGYAGCTTYAEREREENANSLSRNYKNVSNNAAYVEMKGTYSEVVEDKIRTAEVKYTVHLGYVASVDGHEQTPDPKDFNNKRNCNYTYTATIKGVENIIVESRLEDDNVENQPGAEGDVVEATTYMSLDAHYEVKNITFKWEDLDEKTMSVQVKTPFTNGVEKYHVTEKETINLTDYEWVTFVKKPDNESSFALFPENPADRLTIVKVLADLKAFKEDEDEKGKSRTYTAYIDEYYYEDKNWHEFVNKDNREMNILCNTESSPDGESSYTSTSVMFSQRSIKTFYNDKATTAWGIETIMEGNELTSQGYNANDPDNGRYNNYLNINYTNDVTDWAYYLYLHKNTLKKYKSIMAYACLNRNRDLDGNGKISHDEVRWYLPAINQYTGIWMGKDGLPSEAHLYKNGTAGIYHMMSSDGTMFWAEEGSSTGGGTDGSYYRCARNLGMTADDKKATAVAPSKDNYPANYVTKNDNGTLFTLSLMNDRSVREKKADNGELANHNELSSINRPYKSFEVAKEAVTSTKMYHYWKETVDHSPCSTYSEDGEGKNWRMPNQREISLMTAYCDLVRKQIQVHEYNYIWSKTSSSLSTKGGLGYASTGSIVTIPTRSYEGMGVRCVRDRD